MTYLYVRLSSGAHVALYAQFLTTRWDGSIITDLCFATGSKVDWTDGLAAYSKTKGPRDHDTIDTLRQTSMEFALEVFQALLFVRYVFHFLLKA